MHSLADTKDILKERLSKKRYIHCLNVADECKNLAKKWKVDTEKAYYAGLVHDICKDCPQSEQKRMVQISTMEISDVEKEIPSLWHAIAGAWYAENVLEVKDIDILNSIRYHTIARSGMSELEKIVYIGDLISVDRTYKDVERIRKLAYTNLEKTMLEALSFSITDVVNKNSKIPYQTVEAYNDYTSIKDK